MQKIACTLVALAAVAMFSTTAMAKKDPGRSGKSNTWQLQMEDVDTGEIVGKATVRVGDEVAPGQFDVSFTVNVDGLDPDIEYVVKSKAVDVVFGFPNPAGKFNVSGAADIPAGIGFVNVREAVTNDLIYRSTTGYTTDPHPATP